jgi:hypothetical protein
VLHRKVPVPFAVRVVLDPEQIEVSDAIICAKGDAPTVTTTGTEAVHPLAAVTVTKYVVVVVGATTILGDVEPSDHRYEIPPVAVNVAICPEHTMGGEAVEVAFIWLTVTVTLAVLVQLKVLVTVTVYVVVVVGLCVTTWLVPPGGLLHWYVPPPPAVRVTVLPVQTVVGFIAAVATGTRFTTIVMLVDVAAVHPVALTVTV